MRKSFHCVNLITFNILSVWRISPVYSGFIYYERLYSHQAYVRMCTIAQITFHWCKLFRVFSFRVPWIGSQNRLIWGRVIHWMYCHFRSIPVEYINRGLGEIIIIIIVSCSIQRVLYNFFKPPEQNELSQTAKRKTNHVELTILNRSWVEFGQVFKWDGILSLTLSGCTVSVHVTTLKRCWSTHVSHSGIESNLYVFVGVSFCVCVLILNIITVAENTLISRAYARTLIWVTLTFMALRRKWNILHERYCSHWIRQNSSRIVCILQWSYYHHKSVAI